MFSEFLAAALTAETSVATFDFFDTLVFRSAPDPVAIFSRLADELKNQGALPSGFVSARFVHLRSQAEQTARERKFKEYGTYEVSLPEIYNEFSETGVLRRKFSRERLAEIEETVEADSIQVFPPAAEVYRTLVKSGKKVVIVSDTYFSQSLFEKIIKKADLPTPDAIFLSHEWKTGKGGDLWAVVLRSLKVHPHQIRHVGDNYHVDHERPSQLGIRCFHIPHGSSEYFGIVRDEFQFGDSNVLRYSKSWLTSSRAKYMTDAAIRKDKHKIYGYTVLGPLFASFIAFARRTFSDLDVDAILPFAREGIYLHELMKELGTDTALLDPISISRRVMRVISMRDIDEASLLKVLEGPFPPSVAQALEILGLAGNIFLPPQFSPSSLLATHASRVEFVRWVLSQPALVESITGYAARCDALFNRYFMSFVMCIPNPDNRRLRLGVLDIGWNGSIQNMLQEWCNEKGIPVDLIGVYVMTTGATNDRFLSKTEAYGFLVDGNEPYNIANWLFRTLEILEQCSTPVNVGSLIGFHSDGSMIESAQYISKEQSEQIRAIQLGIIAFCKLYWKVNGGSAPTQNEVQILLALAQRAFLNPATHELDLFANWHHDENLLSQRLDPILPTSALWTLEYMTPIQLLRTPMSEIYWPFGASKMFHPLLNTQIAALRSGVLQENETATTIGAVEVWATSADKRFKLAETPLQININGAALVAAYARSPLSSLSFVFRFERPTAIDLRRLGLTLEVQGQRNRKAISLSHENLSQAIEAVEGIRVDENIYIFGQSGELHLSMQVLSALADEKLVTATIELGVALAPLNQRLAHRLLAMTPIDLKLQPEQLVKISDSGWVDAINRVPVFSAEEHVEIEVEESHIQFFGWVATNSLPHKARLYLMIEDGAEHFFFAVSRTTDHPSEPKLNLMASIDRSMIPLKRALKISWVAINSEVARQIAYNPSVSFVSARTAEEIAEAISEEIAEVDSEELLEANSDEVLDEVFEVISIESEDADSALSLLSMTDENLEGSTARTRRDGKAGGRRQSGANK